VRTPLVRLRAPEQPGAIYLKLENLQPIGSFKLRGALNAVLQEDPDRLRTGILTASAGNMGQGVAWAARELGVPCAVVVPEGAAATKLAAIEALGGRVVDVPYERWWQAIAESSFPEIEGVFIHPVQDERVMAGNGTIGLEILEDLLLAVAASASGSRAR
jgi:threonine dehydratase